MGRRARAWTVLAAQRTPPPPPPPGEGVGAAAEVSTGRLGRARSLPAVGSFRHEPGPGDADEAPERGEDDDREGEGVRRHGPERDAQAGMRVRIADAPVRAGPARAVGAEHAQQDPAAQEPFQRARPAQALQRVARGGGAGGGGLSSEPEIISFEHLLQFASFG